MSETPAFHEAANIFPLMDESALAELAADIAANGLREPIWRHRDGRIIDGRNRWLACAKVGVTCHGHTYQGDDDSIVPFVISHNLHRRHLTESQRAMIGGRIANMSAGYHGNQWDRSSDRTQTSRGDAAALVNVSDPSVGRARRVLRDAEPEVVAAVDKGALSVAAASKISAYQPEEQRRQLGEHLSRGGTDKRQKGTPKMKAADRDIPNLRPGETCRPKLQVVHDRDDGMVDQVFALLHRLREVAGKTSADDLYARMPERLLHNLDMSLDRATGFLVGLQAVHHARSAEKKNAAV